MRDEGGLHRMKRVAICDAFDRLDRGAIEAHGKLQAGIDAPAVDQHGASAALAAVAALLGAGKLQPFAQQIEQGDTGIVERNGARLTVDGESDSQIHALFRSKLWPNRIRRGALRARGPSRSGDRGRVSRV